MRSALPLFSDPVRRTHGFASTPSARTRPKRRGSLTWPARTRAAKGPARLPRFDGSGGPRWRFCRNTSVRFSEAVLTTVDGCRVGAALVDRDLLGQAVQFDGAFEESPRRHVVSVSPKQEVDRVAITINSRYKSFHSPPTLSSSRPRKEQGTPSLFGNGASRLSTCLDNCVARSSGETSPCRGIGS